jgi:3-deoxy-D-manno-octulosonic-acid transferase
MGLWYRLASIALIGGSLVKIGGHNPFEALQLKCQVLHGPYVENFSESYELLNVNHQSELVETIEQLGKRICNSFSDAAEQVAPNIEKNLNNFLKDLVHYSRKKM